MSKNEGAVVSKSAFQAVGLKWEGTYEQAATGEINLVHAEIERRQSEVLHRVNPSEILGVSYTRKDGFTYFLCVEVSHVDTVPEGMVAISVPGYRYATVRKTPEISVNAAYDQVYTYMRESGLEETEDPLSMVELYAAKRDPANLEFQILIPLKQS